MASWTDQGEELVAQILFNVVDPATVFDPIYIGLYQNVTEPAEDATLADLSELAVGAGYARIALDRGTWTVLNGVASYAQQIFTATGAWGNQYGYFLTDVDAGTAGNLIAVESFSDGPYNVGTGDSVKVACRVTIA